MSFLDNITKKMGEAAKTVGDAAKTATKKTEVMIEISKLNKAISTEQDKINKIYTDMGKAVYSRFLDNGEADPAFAEGCEQISDIEKNISSIKEKIEELKKEEEQSAQKNTVNTVPTEAPAAEAPQSQYIPTENVPQPDAPAEKKFCPSCGAKLDEGVKFCPSCGNKL